MPVTHSRRQTIRFDLDDTSPSGKAELVHTLMRLRGQLAVAAATFEAHGLDGALGMLEQQVGIENAIRVIVPHIYRQRWAEWLEEDSKLIHTPDMPSPWCHVCTIASARAD